MVQYVYRGGVVFSVRGGRAKDQVNANRLPRRIMRLGKPKRYLGLTRFSGFLDALPKCDVSQKWNKLIIEGVHRASNMMVDHGSMAVGLRGGPAMLNAAPANLPGRRRKEMRGWRR